MLSISTTQNLNGESDARRLVFENGGLSEGKKAEVKCNRGLFTFKMKGGKILRISNF